MLIMAGANQFCADTWEIWQFVGYILMIFKIVIPLLLLILGMFDLGKAVVASDDKAIKKATTQLAYRAVAAIVIFFVPTIIGFVFSIVNGFNNDAAVKANYTKCKDCLVSPTNNTKCNGNAVVINAN
ncbi:MAG: hypothetical protein IJN03_00240 [Bacilli bacterium]|nr:hypothetical protein [Bacilli bacterium]